MLPSTTERVPSHSPAEANSRIREQTIANIASSAIGGASSINQRLAELEREWDIERALEANAASAALLGVMLGALVHKRFFIVPGIVGAFLLQHALQGWCPPVPILRRLGVRTAREIGCERNSLKALRGDYENIRPDGIDTAAAPKAFEAASMI